METIQYQTEIKANKHHECNYCGFAINKGDKYYKSVLKYDTVYTWKSHIECQEVAETLRMFDNCDEGVTMEDFKEIIRERYLELDLDNSTNNFLYQLEIVKKALKK